MLQVLMHHTPAKFPCLARRRCLVVLFNLEIPCLARRCCLVVIFNLQIIHFVMQREQIIHLPQLRGPPILSKCMGCDENHLQTY